jgi:aspartyl-tRNA(Asn)/glutamyl-tRNA(Gln) amidotransferase subunit B
MDELQLTPGALAEMISLIDAGVISGKIAKDVLPRLLAGEASGSSVKAFVESQGLVQISGGWRAGCAQLQVAQHAAG